MSANVRVCARVRPLPPNAEGRSILEVESGSEASVRVAKDGCAKHFFTRVYGPQSTQDDLFNSVGAPAVDEVLAGFHATVVVYGQTASGKTYTLGCTDEGKEGIQPRAIRYLFSRIGELSSEACRVTVQAEYVQVYKESVIDLIDPAHDRVDMLLDPVHGVSLSGNTKVAVASGDQFLSLVARGDRSRQTASTSLNTASSRSHACLVVTVRRAALRGGKEVSASEGRLHLVDLAGSDRADKAGAQSEAYRETVAINKSLTVLGSCVHGVVSGQKVIPFRESKLTRLLQHCLSGNGKTTVIVTLHPAESQLNETTRTLQFGARSMREQAAVTVDDCRGELEELRLALAQQQERHAALRAECTVEERSLVEVQAGCDDVDARLKASEVRALTETDAVRASMHAAYADKLVRYGEQLEMQKRKLGAAVVELRENNKEHIEAAEQHRGEKLALVQEETQRQKEAVDEKLAELQARLSELEEQAARQTADLPDEEALKEQLRSSRAELEDMKTRIRECTPSPYEGYSLLELRRTLRKVRRQNASLRNKARDLTMLRDDQARTSKFVESKGGFSEQPSMRYADDDVASDESITASTITASSQRSFTDSPPSSPSSGEGEIARERKNYLTPEEILDRKHVKDTMELTKEEEDKLFRTIETKHLKDAVRKEQHFRELLERILQYLEGGSPVWCIQGEELERQFLYTDRGRGQLYMVKEHPDGTPDRDNFTDVLPMKVITRIYLGQQTPGFAQFHGEDFKPDPTTRETRSHAETFLDTENVSEHYYRSFTLVVVNPHTGTSRDVDLVCCVDNDFEAWVVGLLRLVGIESRHATWSPESHPPVEIQHLPRYHELEEDEREICVELHLSPKTFLAAQEFVCSADTRLFLTLYDIRTHTGLELLTAEKLFRYFQLQGYLELQTVWMVASKKSGMQGPGRRHLT